MYSIIAICLLVILGITILNCLATPDLEGVSSDEPLPSVSVLIPARNEAATIEGIIRDIAASKGVSSLELVVLNDNSTDSTAAILQTLQQEIPLLSVQDGAPLPEAWPGKNYACHQLAQNAKGEFLLFLDADVRLSSTAICKALTFAVHNKLDLLSCFPEQRCVTLWEKLTVPFIDVLAYSLLPTPLVARTHEPSLSAANGQFMLFRRSAYEAIGGHGAVRAHVVEDIALARTMKRVRLKTDLISGTGEVFCRMYQSLDDLREGLGRSLVGAFSSKLSLTLFLLVLMTLYLAPFFMGWGALIMLIYAVRAMIAVRFRHSAISVAFHPIGIGAILGFACEAAVKQSRKTLQWKGRTIGS